MTDSDGIESIDDCLKDLRAFIHRVTMNFIKVQFYSLLLAKIEILIRFNPRLWASA